MSNRYFIWKEANCQEINSKWVEISGREFYSLLKESPKKRYFESAEIQWKKSGQPSRINTGTSEEGT